jgi:hypothetical protein
VAALLETLLPQSTDEAADVVPHALRTLPARLRESGDAGTHDLRDLVLILSRYLPANPRDVLRQLVERSRGAATPVEAEPPRVAAVHRDVVDLPWQTDSVRAPTYQSGATPKRAPLVALMVLVMALSGLLGYRLMLNSGSPAPAATAPDGLPSDQGHAGPCRMTHRQHRR